VAAINCMTCSIFLHALKFTARQIELSWLGQCNGCNGSRSVAMAAMIADQAREPSASPSI
jgi:hypothetical protein